LHPKERPSRWYLTGFLIPSGTPPEQASDIDEDDPLDIVLETAASIDESTEDQQAAKKGLYPSSMGLSFLIAAEVNTLTVTVTWGDYAMTKYPGTENYKPGSVWQRFPGKSVITVNLDGRVDPIVLDVPESNGLQIQILERVIPADGLAGQLPKGVRSVSLFLVNHRSLPATQSDTAYIFQPRLTVCSEIPFVPRPDLRGIYSGDFDDDIADLHYADTPAYATGHGIATDWEITNGHCHLIRTAWIPGAEVEKTKTQPIRDVILKMDELGALDSGEPARKALQPIVTEYRNWIILQKESFGNLSDVRRETATELLRRANLAADRIEAGIMTLVSDALSLEAFRVANRAVSRALKQRLKIDDPKWHAFQLAFVLLNLSGVADPSDKHRETVDLLFFPTGGGKTEAYLGLAAFTMVLRRLRFPGDDGRAGGGVSVIMRYTLRLLTLDQLGRAAGMVCALELERKDNLEKYGDWPFEIGLWVGKAATPNNMGRKGDKRSDTARIRVKQFKGNPRYKPSPIPLETCPWCKTKFTADSFHLKPNADEPTDMLITCSNFDCEFCGDNALPIVAIDEPLYRRLPAFLIATVDKFAQLPWVGSSGMLLGGADRYDENGYYGAAGPNCGKRLTEPLQSPDLIIQDELHLISGPLGTMTGLFESAIEALCVRNLNQGRFKPKIIASTATVRRAGDQIQALFARSITQVFPPSGPDRRDSFFAKTQPSSEVAARLYLGIAAQGRSPKLIMRRIWLALMGAAEKAFREAGGHKNQENPADPYMTVLGYFNSLRELGGARRILEEQVQNTIKDFGMRRRFNEPRGLFTSRKKFNPIVELTSRVSTNQVAEARRRLETPYIDMKDRVDCAIATNMISVGLDISRLGLMVVLGQPKTHAEYIQATSRVGRDDKRPGLVVTLLNVHKPRDRSHYERFRHYHETFYRSVEVSSVTPFSARALDRGFAGILVALARHLDTRLTPSRGVEAITAVDDTLRQQLLDIFLERVRNQPFADEKEQQERERSVQNRIAELLDAWKKIIKYYRDDGVRVQYQKYEGRSTDRPFLRDMLNTDFELPEQKKFRANRSMRDVEPQVNLNVINGLRQKRRS
ncbi:DISARM system helicase DrmA, partial [bacterium]|nr:DISARM system helicase DrmA [bacterium]